MPDDIMSSIKIFADDTKAFKDVQTQDDMLIFQKDVDSLCDWSLKWQLKFNATKCTHMTYGNPNIRSQYNIKEGDGKLTDIRHDGEAMIGLARLTFHYMDEEVFRLHVYTSLMRPDRTWTTRAASAVRI